MSKHARAMSLVMRYQEECGSDIPWYDNQDLFAAWFENLSGDVKPATYTKYRMWLSDYASYLGHPELEAVILKASRKDEDAVTPKSKEVPNQEAQKVADKWGPAQMSRLMEVLISQRGGGPRYKDGIITATWFIYGCQTGIRPVEWMDTVLLTNVKTDQGHLFPYVLDVPIALKGAYSKKQGETLDKLRRYLVLDDWSEQDVRQLREFMEHLPNDKKAFAKLQESVRQTLLKASSVGKLGHNVSLYLGRHLFASEVRRSKESSRYELAAMMGHSDTVNQKFYGDRSMGEGRLFDFKLVKPWPGAAEKIEAVDRKRYSLVYGGDSVVDMKRRVGELPGDMDF